LDFLPVVATGTYDPQDEVLLRGRSLDGQPGYHVLTPLVLDATAGALAGRALLVERGWVPYDMDRVPVEAALPPAGSVTVRGARPGRVRAHADVLRRRRAPAAAESPRAAARLPDAAEPDAPRRGRAAAAAAGAGVRRGAAPRLRHPVVRLRGGGRGGQLLPAALGAQAARRRSRRAPRGAGRGRAPHGVAPRRRARGYAGRSCRHRSGRRLGQRLRERAEQAAERLDELLDALLLELPH